MSHMTEERLMIQQTARDFAMKEVLPVANELDPVQGDIPMELRAKMAELGYFGILVPEEYGGLGLGVFEYALVTEELARAWMSVASIIARGNSRWGDLRGSHCKPPERGCAPKAVFGIAGGCCGADAAPTSVPEDPRSHSHGRYLPGDLRG